VTGAPALENLCHLSPDSHPEKLEQETEVELANQAHTHLCIQSAVSVIAG